SSCKEYCEKNPSECQKFGPGPKGKEGERGKPPEGMKQEEREKLSPPQGSSEFKQPEEFRPPENFQERQGPPPNQGSPPQEQPSGVSPEVKGAATIRNIVDKFLYFLFKKQS
ncbi:MAG: hypothetical protein AAB437_04380, partial [Patescibacteria group bacterium]